MNLPMINKLLIILFLFLNLELFGQDTPWYFSLNMGKSWPIGAFSQNSTNELNTGFAQTGFSLSLESNYAVNDNFAFKGLVLLNTHSLNRLPLWNVLNQELNRTLASQTINPKFLSLNVNPWESNSLLFGPVYTFLVKNLKWDFYATGGLSLIYLPQPKLIYEDPLNTWIYINRNTTKRSYSYGFNAGSSVRFPISEKFDFRVAFNYFHAKAIQKFEEVKITTTQSSTTIQQLNTGKATVPIDALSATLGLVYYLK
jgi:hypothetical protein